MRCSVLGHFVTESSEHFCRVQCRGLLNRRRSDCALQGAADEYPETLRRNNRRTGKELRSIKPPVPYRHQTGVPRVRQRTIMNALWTGEPSVIYGNVRNEGLIDNLP